MTVVERWFEEVWNQGNEQAIDDLLDPDCVVHGLTSVDGSQIQGAAAFKPYFRNLRSSLSDISVIVEETLVSGDKQLARCSVTAAHTGDGLGVSATGKPVTFSGMSLVTVRNGRIVEGWNNFDFFSLYQQIQ